MDILSYFKSLSSLLLFVGVVYSPLACFSGEEAQNTNQAQNPNANLNDNVSSNQNGSEDSNLNDNSGNQNHNGINANNNSNSNDNTNNNSNSNTNTNTCGGDRICEVLALKGDTTKGKDVFSGANTFCGNSCGDSGCHGADGNSGRGVPRLSNEISFLSDKQLVNLILKGKGRDMPGFASCLDNGEIANLLAYLRKTFP